MKNYCNEYIYKNIITQQLYLGKHYQDSNIITEFRVSKCKADVVILNGTSTVYEIKSELDSFIRLERQISAYTSFFDLIYVITCNSQLNNLKSKLRDEIGIMVLNPNNTINEIREPLSNKLNVDPSVIFNSLRKPEYLSIIRDNYDSLPGIPNTQIYKYCHDLFCKFSPEKAHDAALTVLKRRENSSCLGEYLKEAPNFLKAYIISSKINENKVHKLKELLGKRVSTILSPTVC